MNRLLPRRFPSCFLTLAVDIQASQSPNRAPPRPAVGKSRRSWGSLSRWRFWQDLEKSPQRIWQKPVAIAEVFTALVLV